MEEKHIVIFIGFITPKKYRLNNLAFSSAGYNYQINFIKLLNKTMEKVIVWSFLPILSSRKFSNSLIKKGFISEEGLNYEMLPFINLPFIKLFSMFYSACNRIKLLLKTNKKMKLTFVLFNPFPPMSFLINYFKFFNIGKSIVIIADFPSNSVIHSGIRSFLNILFIRSSIKAIKKSDGQILLNKKASDVFNLNNFQVIEGFLLSSERNPLTSNIPYFDSSLFHIVYTGSIHPINNIEFLINIFLKLSNPLAKLHIIGDGSLLKIIMKKYIHPNVIFYGKLEYNLVLEIIQNADILVNPLNMQKVGIYSFPSKLFDYISTKKVILSYYLFGFSSKVNNLFITAKTNESFFRKLKYLTNLDKNSLSAIGLKKFILAKSYYEQNKFIKKIKTLMKKIWINEI